MIVDWIRHTRLDIEPGICYGNTDVDVGPTFVDEAKVVRSNLSTIEYDKVFTSPLQRAIKLATYCGYDDAEKDYRVKEFNFGDWEMKPWYELFQINNVEDSSWFDDWYKIEIPGGENLETMIARVRSFITEKMTMNYDRIACFCHGGTINCAQYIKGDIDIDDIFRDNPDYGEIVTIKYHSIDSLR